MNDSEVNARWQAGMGVLIDPLTDPATGFHRRLDECSIWSEAPGYAHLSVLPIDRSPDAVVAAVVGAVERAVLRRGGAR
jgi:hypothetical protein